MVTNSIQELKDGRGAYSFFLNAQGRIQGDATVFAEPEALMIETASSRISDLISFLDRFIIMDDVELADAKTRAWASTSPVHRQPRSSPVSDSTLKAFEHSQRERSRGTP